MKTSELTGPALDWAVAKCEGYEYEFVPGIKGVTMLESNTMGGFPWLHIPEPVRKVNQTSAMPLHCFSPSTDWAQGGPITEREGIELTLPTWKAETASYLGGQSVHTGPTQLIAAMRCYVASKLGDEVEIPEELR